MAGTGGARLHQEPDVRSSARPTDGSHRPPPPRVDPKAPFELGKSLPGSGRSSPPSMLAKEFPYAWVFSPWLVPRMRSMTHRRLMCSGIPSIVFGADLTRPIPNQETGSRNKEGVK
jgi:hypothetical protein